MADGTLQFDGVDDEALTSAFVFPEKFTVFWDIDWLGSEIGLAGVVHTTGVRMYNFAAQGTLKCYIKGPAGAGFIPNTSVGLSTNGNVYAPDGSITPFGGTVGTDTGGRSLYIAKVGSNYTQMGFRQLLIFNKELSQAEVNEVLTTMFPV